MLTINTVTSQIHIPQRLLLTDTQINAGFGHWSDYKIASQSHASEEIKFHAKTDLLPT